MKRILIVCAITLSFLISCGGNKQEAKDSAKLTPEQETELLGKAKQIFGVLPDKMPGSENDTPERIALGKKLYFETKLSSNDKQSCNTCHDILGGSMAGVDNKQFSNGAKDGKIGTRNSPTVLNAGFQFVQFWDGRAKDLKEQAKGPILNPVEMAMTTDKDVMKKLSVIPEYVDMFKKAFPKESTPLTYDNLAEGVAAFERTLISKSRYDNYINGNPTALTSLEKTGMKTFIDIGCITCHTGIVFGGNMYQKMGLLKPYTDVTDMGKFSVTKNEADKFIFKVGMLRNIALTHPYFHDGGAKTLDEAIKIMADINLGKTLKQEEIASIKSFLNSLTDVNLEKNIKN